MWDLKNKLEGGPSMKFDKRKILAGMALVVFIGLGTGASY